MTCISYDDLQSAASQRSLTLLGGFHPDKDEVGLEDCRTLLMVGPDERHFWPRFLRSDEYLDGRPDPVDRWSIRVVGDLATIAGARALYPFGDAPYLPFYQWALRTQNIHISPVRLLVSDDHGLFVSFRGALSLPHRIDLPAAVPSPCISCATKPCLAACPVDAMGDHEYSDDACRAHIRSSDGHGCLTQGCAVRRACPASLNAGRRPAHSAYHMSEFLRTGP
jgi:epoxyqueuosine reductase